MFALLVATLFLLASHDVYAITPLEIADSLAALRSQHRKSTFTLAPPLSTNATMYYYLEGAAYRVVIESSHYFVLEDSLKGRMPSLTLISPSTLNGVFRPRESKPIRFYIESLDSSHLSMRAIRNGLGRLFTNFGRPQWTHPVTVNTTSRLTHSSDCNHLPPATHALGVASLEEAQAAGYLPCLVCFPPRSYIRIPHYDFERSLGLEQRNSIRKQFDDVNDLALTQRVTAIGERVLNRWPLPLRGYEYSFSVVESSSPNAMACATGMIVVTTGLLAIIEDDAELEAVLAHEIAHCERRHALMNYRAAVDNANAAYTAAIFTRALIATSDMDPTAAYAAANLSTILIAVAAQSITAGHGRENEEEADAYCVLYMRTNAPHESQDAHLRVLSKLQYSETMDGASPRRPEFLPSHPNIEHRIRSARTTLLHVPETPRIFHGMNAQGELVATLTFEAWSTAPDNEFGERVTALRNAGLPTRIQEFKHVRIYGTIEYHADLPSDCVMNSVAFAESRTHITFDNFEDTRVYSGEPIAFSLKGSVRKETFVEALDVFFVTGLPVKTWRLSPIGSPVDH